MFSSCVIMCTVFLIALSISCGLGTWDWKDFSPFFLLNLFLLFLFLLLCFYFFAKRKSVSWNRFTYFTCIIFNFSLFDCNFFLGKPKWLVSLFLLTFGQSISEIFTVSLKFSSHFTGNAAPICASIWKNSKCASEVVKYYFDAASNMCQAFKYYSCLGNDNKFDSLQQCQETCVQSTWEASVQ